MEEAVGYQIRSAGLLISLLGEVYLAVSQESVASTRIEQIIKKAREIIRQMPLTEPLDAQAIAVKLGLELFLVSQDV